MKQGAGLLLLAGGSGIAAVVTAASALTITLIAAGHLPTLRYLSPAQNTAEAARVAALWQLPAFNLVCAAGVLLMMVFRARLGRAQPGLARWKIDVSPLVIVSVLGLLCIGAAARSILLAAEGLRTIGPAPITDSPLFSGMGMSLGISSNMLTIFCYVTFRSWASGPRSQWAATRAQGVAPTL
jgi:hypothetical protein